MSVNWNVRELEECESTFNEARRQPAWTVVTTRNQTRGRGRFNRTWFGGPGGLWATYNLPVDPDSDRQWGMLPLVAGAGLTRALGKYGIEGLRLRWPNDVLVGRAKLAGILVERPSATMVSVGIGVNMFNRIAELQGMTSDPVTRLCELVPDCPAVETFRDQLGTALAEIFDCFVEGGLESIAPVLKQAWGDERPVVAITDTQRITGFFTGIDATGSPLLRQADGRIITVPALEINRLKELI